MVSLVRASELPSRQHSACVWTDWSRLSACVGTLLPLWSLRGALGVCGVVIARRRKLFKKSSSFSPLLASHVVHANLFSYWAVLNLQKVLLSSPLVRAVEWETTKQTMRFTILFCHCPKSTFWPWPADCLPHHSEQAPQPVREPLQSAGLRKSLQHKRSQQPLQQWLQLPLLNPQQSAHRQAAAPARQHRWESKKISSMDLVWNQRRN